MNNTVNTSGNRGEIIFMNNLPMQLVFIVAIGDVIGLHSCHGASYGHPKNYSQYGSINGGAMKIKSSLNNHIKTVKYCLEKRQKT